MRIGEAPATKIRHRVRLPPDDVVEDPEAEILHQRPDAEDVVVAADHPDGAVRLQEAAAGGDPVAGEFVIGREAGEFVPILGDAVDPAVVGPQQFIGDLQIVGGIGEDQIDACLRQTPHLLDAIADDNLVERQPCRSRPIRTHNPPALRNTKVGHAEGFGVKGGLILSASRPPIGPAVHAERARFRRCCR